MDHPLVVTLRCLPGVRISCPVFCSQTVGPCGSPHVSPLSSLGAIQPQTVVLLVCGCESLKAVGRANVVVLGTPTAHDRALIPVLAALTGRALAGVGHVGIEPVDGKLLSVCLFLSLCHF